MDESTTCECGNEVFWFFGHFVRCPKCYKEYGRDGKLPSKINHIPLENISTTALKRHLRMRKNRTYMEETK